MPKVTERYLANKRKEIIDAAMRVCEAKPAYKITLRDVVRECGISVGGIYNYFASIDDIFVEIINYAYADLPSTLELSEMLESESPVSEIITVVFKHKGRRIDDLYGRYGKFMLELDSIMLNDVERRENIISKYNGTYDWEAFVSLVSAFITKHVNDGTIKPIVPLPHILLTIGNGVNTAKDVVITGEFAYKRLLELGLTEQECSTAEGMMEVLAGVVLELLGKPK